jgi:hypothetical protein
MEQTAQSPPPWPLPLPKVALPANYTAIHSRADGEAAAET